VRSVKETHNVLLTYVRMGNVDIDKKDNHVV